MPRLVGKQSNTPVYLLLYMILILVSLGALEYEGVINIIPGWGKDDYNRNLQIRPMSFSKKPSISRGDIKAKKINQLLGRVSNV